MEYEVFEKEFLSGFNNLTRRFIPDKKDLKDFYEIAERGGYLAREGFITFMRVLYISGAANEFNKK